MTILDFKPEDALPPPRDEAPPTTDGDICKHPDCSNPVAPYGGRGPRPKFCTEHKGNKGAPSGKRSLSSNDTRARAAATALVQLHGIAAMGLMLVHMPETASALAGSSEGFEQQAYEALLTDPALCSAILKAGTTSGRMSLLIAYAMLAGAVVPTGWQEYRELHPKKTIEGELTDEVRTGD